MIEELISQAKQQLSGELKQKQGLNDQQVNDTFGAAKDSLLNAVKQQSSGGGLGQLTSLFNGNTELAPTLISTASKFLIPVLVSKLNIPEAKAKSISDMVVPFLVNKFSGKESGSVSNPADLLGKLTGGEGGIGGALKGLF